MTRRRPPAPTSIRTSPSTCPRAGSAHGPDPLAEVIADLAFLVPVVDLALPSQRGAPSDDAEPTAATILALLHDPATGPGELADAVAWCYDDDALTVLLPLAHHHDARVRRAVAQALPSVLGDAAPDDTVLALLGLSGDSDS